MVRVPPGDMRSALASRWFFLALSFLAYLTIFALALLPWLRVADRAIPGVVEALSWGDDARLLIWVQAWVTHALSTGPQRLFDANINYPAPAQLAGSEHLGSTQVLFAPIYLATGNAVAASNVVLFLSYPLAALAMQRMLVLFGCGGGVASVVGLLFALGPLRVPANVQTLQYPNLYLPLLGAALFRLAQRPTVRWAAVVALVFTLGVFGSYHLAVMLPVTAATLVAVLATYGVGARRRGFIMLATASLVVPIVLLAVASRPYFHRPEAAAPTLLMFSGPNAAAAHRFVLRKAVIPWIGPAELALASLGVLALIAGDAPRLVGVLGLTVTLVGWVMMLGPTQHIANHDMPLPFHAVEILGGRFFRMPWRFVVVAGFGHALLAAAGLEMLGRLVGRGLRPVLAAVIAAIVLGVRATALLANGVDNVLPASDTREIHQAVGAVAAELGSGPLLELPLRDNRRPDRDPTKRNFEPDAMVGSTYHWLPLVNGHTGYDPPHRALLLQTIARLPAPDALADLVDMTHLRWLLLRPASDWEQPAIRAALLALPSVSRSMTRDGWVLARVLRPPAHPEWFRAIASGTRPTETVLGTVNGPLSPENAVASVAVIGGPG